MAIPILPQFPNQGQMIASGWNNTSGLTNFTALFGSDGLRFPAVYDRTYSTGIIRQLTTGGVKDSGMPVIRVTIPYISYGQINYLLNTLCGGSESANVTYRGHKPNALTAADVTTWNAVSDLDLNQLPNLTKRPGGYEAYILKLVLVEVI